MIPRQYDSRFPFGDTISIPPAFSKSRGYYMNPARTDLV